MLKFVAFGALLLISSVPVAAAEQVASATGQGKLSPDRTFAFTAQVYDDGTAEGMAIIVNNAFDGSADNPSPYRAKIDLQCAHRIDDKTVVFGGMTQRSNDPNLIDAAFFTVRDNGEPGAGKDEISRLYFWDDIPSTTGDPMTCLLVGADAFPLEVIEAGNVQVKTEVVE